MPAARSQNTVVLRGYTDLIRAFQLAGRDFSRNLQDELKDIAEPIRQDAETLAATRVRNMTPSWARMRAVVRRRITYVAPVERGTRTKRTPQRARPNLADLLMDRAMQPALDAHAEETVIAVDRLVGRLGTEWTAV